jgi:hypothetical protein
LGGRSRCSYLYISIGVEESKEDAALHLVAPKGGLVHTNLSTSQMHVKEKEWEVCRE